MPHMNGIEVCRRNRSFSRVPILVLSALDDELLARIRAALRRTRAQRDDEPVIRVGGIELDQVARRRSRCARHADSIQRGCTSE